jgi:protein-tyrosine-phosphatase
VIVFVCEHGVAKSVLAAALFNDMATKRGLPFRAEHRAADTPQREPSVSTNKGLAADGLPIPEGVPLQLSAQDIREASRVITLGISRPVAGTEGKSQDWADVPTIGDGYAAARDATQRHVTELIDELTRHPR